ncbi:MAG: HAD-IA family hydrolase, partial [Pseudomonadales bacterium]
LVSEFELDISPDTFLRAFVEWPRGPFDGAIDLLESLKDKYHLACLSNTNHLHWARFESETRLLSSLDSHFASHLIGIMKPDPEIYHHTIHSLGCAPAAILFLDDNPVNVDSARSCGMQSELVSGISSVQQTLQRKGLVQGFPDANL